MGSDLARGGAELEPVELFPKFLVGTAGADLLYSQKPARHKPAASSGTTETPPHTNPTQALSCLSIWVAAIISDVAIAC